MYIIICVFVISIRTKKICVKNKKIRICSKTKKIRICLKPKKSEPAWRWRLARSGELAPTHSSSADVSQSIVTTFSLRSRYDMWKNHDMMTICAYDSEHDPRQYEGKRSCLFQENTGNKRRKIDQDKENTWNTWNTKKQAVSFVPICIQEKGPVVVQQAAAAPSPCANCKHKNPDGENNILLSSKFVSKPQERVQEKQREIGLICLNNINERVEVPKNEQKFSRDEEWWHWALVPSLD